MEEELKGGEIEALDAFDPKIVDWALDIILGSGYLSGRLNFQSQASARELARVLRERHNAEVTVEDDGTIIFKLQDENKIPQSGIEIID